MAMNNWKVARLVCSFIVLFTFFPLAIYSYLRFGDSLFLVGMIAIPIMIVGEWWQQYRNRNDPDWPRRLRQAAAVKSGAR
jgi:hypothetical protein